MKNSERLNQLQTPKEILSFHSLKFQRNKAIIRNVFLIILFAIFLVVLFSIFGVAKIKGTSMEPTFHEGDIVVFKKNSNYAIRDVVIYKTSSGNKNIKRIVAVQGDIVDISSQGELIVNHNLVEEDEIFFPTYPKESDITYPYTVHTGMVFVLGDHRINSTDSRAVGAISTDDIMGKILVSIEIE